MERRSDHFKREAEKTSTATVAAVRGHGPARRRPAGARRTTEVHDRLDPGRARCRNRRNRRRVPGNELLQTVVGPQRGRTDAICASHDATAETDLAKSGVPSAWWPQFTAASQQTLSLVPPHPQVETDYSAEHNCAFWAAAG